MTARKAFIAAFLFMIGLCTPSLSAKSPLAEGRWVKIRVSCEGIHQITYDELEEWGFSDPRELKIFGYGGAMLVKQDRKLFDPSDLTSIYVYNVPAVRKVFFYGEGCSKTSVKDVYIDYTRNYYDDYGYYFLTDQEMDSDYTILPDEYLCQDYHSIIRDGMSAIVVDIDVQNPANGGITFLEQPIKFGDKRSYTFNIKDYNKNTNLDVYFEYNFAAGVITNSSSSTSLDLEIPAIFTPRSLFKGTAYANGSPFEVYKSAFGWTRCRTSDKNVPDGTYTFTLNNNQNPNQVYCAVDRVGLLYARMNRCNFDGTQVIIDYPYAGDMTDFIFENASPTTVVFNASNPSYARRCSTEFNPETRELKGSLNFFYPRARLVAFDPMVPLDFYQTEYVGEVPNQDIHSAETPEMLIITTKELEEAAHELAQIHGKRGLKCLVVTQEQVFNEFSSGARTPYAFNRCAHMFHTRDHKTLKYILLYGPGCWDARGLQVPLAENRLVTYQSEIPSLQGRANMAAPFDGYVGMMQDNVSPDSISYNHITLPVGRIPAKNLSAARSINNKIRKYLDDPADIEQFMTALMVSDDGDNSVHLSQSDQSVTNLTAFRPGMTAIKVPNLLYPWSGTVAKAAQDRIRKALEDGVGYFSYAGHAQGSGLGNEHLWDRPLVASNSYNRPPFAAFFTCDTYTLDKTTDDFVQDLLAKEDGGAIAIVGAGRSVYLEYNKYFDYDMASTYSAAKPGWTVGDLYAKAHNRIINRKDIYVNQNNMHYNLCGDPSIPLTIDTDQIKLKMLDGIDISRFRPGDSSFSMPISYVPALKQTSISGKLIDASGNTLSDFNGVANLTVYEAERTLTTIVQNAEDLKNTHPTQVNIDQDVMGHFSARVVNGEFEIPFTLPLPAYPGKFNRFVITATSDDKQRRAVTLYGLSSVSTPNDEPSNLPEAPVFVEAYLDDPSFADGDIVDANPVLHARIATSSLGLNFSTAPGSAPVVHLDSKTKFSNSSSFISPDLDNPEHYLLTLPLSNLVAGYHKVRIDVSDNAGQKASTTLSFYVNPNISAGTLTLAEPADPADRSSVTLNLEHPLSANANCTLMIRNAMGKTVLNVPSASFPYKWDLNDANGKPLPDGHYSAWAVIADESRHASTPRIEVPIVR